jgi:hypothetical protein
MNHAIEVWAPWLAPTDAEAMTDEIMRLPTCYRRPCSKELGERLRLTNAERERLKLWRIAPIDITIEECNEQRRAKDRARKRKRYKRSRADYLATSRSKLKPWEAEGISRTTWYERRAKAARTSASVVRTTPFLGKTYYWRGRTDLSGPPKGQQRERVM